MSMPPSGPVQDVVEAFTACAALSEEPQSVHAVSEGLSRMQVETEYHFRFLIRTLLEEHYRLDMMSYRPDIHLGTCDAQDGFLVTVAYLTEKNQDPFVGEQTRDKLNVFLQDLCDIRNNASLGIQGTPNDELSAVALTYKPADMLIAMKSLVGSYLREHEAANGALKLISHLNERFDRNQRYIPAHRLM